METTRQIKVAKQIQKDMSEIFQKNINEWAPGKLITITVVRISPDLGLARIYLSIFPSENTDTIMDLIAYKTNLIRNELAGRIRHQLKKVPELQFFKDDSLDYLDNIDKLLKK